MKIISNTTFSLSKLFLSIFLCSSSFNVFPYSHGASSSHSAAPIQETIILILFLLLLAIWCAISYWYEGFRLKQKANKISEVLKKIALNAPEWSESNLLSIATNKFTILQEARAKNNLDCIKKNLHPLLFSLWEMEIENQMGLNEYTLITGVSISKIAIVDLRHFQDNELDEFTVVVDAKATIQTILCRAIMKSQKTSFREYWSFGRLNDEWVLKRVLQNSSGKHFYNAPIVYVTGKS